MTSTHPPTHHLPVLRRVVLTPQNVCQLRGLREKGVDAASLTSASASQARAAAVINDLQGRCSGGDGAGASEDYRGGIGAAEGDGEGGARPRTKLLYVTPEKLAKSGSLTTTLRGLASR